MCKMVSFRGILVIAIFGYVKSDLCSTSIINFLNANVGDEKLDLDSYRDIAQSLSELKQATLRMEQKLNRMYKGEDYMYIDNFEQKLKHKSKFVSV